MLVGAGSVALAGLLTACGLLPGRRRQIDVEPEPELTQAIINLREDGRSRAVANLTDFEWDRFMLFTIGTPADVINEEAGLIVVTGEQYSTQEVLLLFMHDGVAVRGVPSGAESLGRQARIWFGADTQIVLDTVHGPAFDDPEAGDD